MKKVLFLFLILLGALHAEEDFRVQINNPQILIDGSQNGTVIWGGFDGKRNVVYESLRSLGGNWSAPTRISGLNKIALYPSIFANGSGDTILSWQEFNGSEFRIQTATGSIGTAAGAAQAISFGSSFFSDSVIDNSENKMVCWNEKEDSSGYCIVVAINTGSGFSFPIKVNETNYTYLSSIELALRPTTGEGLVIWEGLNGANRTIETRSLSPELDWGDIAVLSNSLSNAGDPQIAFSANGEGLAAWKEVVNGKLSLKTAIYQNSAWNEFQTLTCMGSNLVNPNLVVNTSGVSFLICECRPEMASSIAFSKRLSQSSWGEIGIIYSNASFSLKSPAIAINGNGEGVAVWVKGTRAGGVIQAARIASNGTWEETPVDLTSTLDCFSPRIALNDSGYAVAVWGAVDGTTYKLQTSTLSAFDGDWGSVETIYSQ